MTRGLGMTWYAIGERGLADCDDAAWMIKIVGAHELKTAL